MTIGTLQIPSFMSATEENSRKVKQSLCSIFVMKINKITVYLQTKKIYFPHCNTRIGWYKVGK
jgi:hypothetical protein